MIIGLLFKIHANTADMLDLLSILYDSELNKNFTLIIITLLVWSWSTFQFFIFLPETDFPVGQKSIFQAYFVDSFCGSLFLDLPYFGLRIAAIFALGLQNNTVIIIIIMKNIIKF
jgi:hypothetical protein